MWHRTIAISLILTIFVCAPGAARAQGDIPEPAGIPHVSTATSAWMGGASKLDVNTLLTEPSIMAVYVFGFDRNEDAEAAYPGIIEFYSTEASSQTDRNYREVSIGIVGDQRFAMYDQTPDLAQALYSIVRAGPSIQVVWLIGIGGDLPAFASSYLQTLILPTQAESLSLVPTVANLPVGWSPIYDEPVDILPQVTRAASPTAVASQTPMPSPTLAPTQEETIIPIVQPRTDESVVSTIMALEDRLAASEADLESADATIISLETNAPGGSLHPDPVTIVVQVDIRGVLQEDRQALDDAERELQAALEPYLGGDACQIGFAMISSRANELGDGVLLSQAIGDLISVRFSEVVPDESEALLFEAIALPGTEPVGEVELRLFFYDDCSALSE